MSRISEQEVSSSQTPVSQSVHFARGTNQPKGQTLVTQSAKGRSTRRHAPYKKTPHSRSLARHPTKAQGRTPDKQQDAEPPDFSGLLSKTWRIYRVSPLYKFDHNNSALKKYSRSLSSYIQAAQRAGMAVEPEEWADGAIFSIYKGLTDTNTDKDAVQILLKGKPRSGKGPNVVVLTAIMFGLHVTEDNRLIDHPSFTNLPVMLINGPVRLGEHLIQWLKRDFDCCISPLKFSPVDLSWLVAMWAGGLAEKRPKPVEFVYRVPAEVEGLSRITMNLDAAACKELWQKIHTGDTDEFLEESVATFVKSIERHFFTHFRIHLRVMPLIRIGTSIGMIGAEGRLKMFDNKHVVQVLRHMTEISLER